MYAFFRRRTANPNNAANGPKAKQTDQKASRRNFGRVGSLQHIRHKHNDEDNVPDKRAASEENHSAKRQPSSQGLRTPPRANTADKLDNQEPMSPPPPLAIPTTPVEDDEQPPVSANATPNAKSATENGEGELQPKLSKSRSSKGKRKSSRRPRERERERERDHEHRHHHHGHRERHDRHEQQAHTDEATLLVELNKLLDTLNARELQLSMRVDKADEAVRAALAMKKRGDVELARKRALYALKQKRTLERSLSVTTAQTDHVLRLMGQNVLTPLSERIEAGIIRAKNGATAAQVDAVALASALKNNGNFDDCDDEQILREIDATIAEDMVPNNETAPVRVSPGGSIDWLAEVREQYAKKQDPPEREEIPQRVEPASFDHNTDDFETLPEVSFEKPRPSREKRPARLPVRSKSAAVTPSTEKPSRLKSAPSFSRKKRK